MVIVLLAGLFVVSAVRDYSSHVPLLVVDEQGSVATAKAVEAPPYAPSLGDSPSSEPVPNPDAPSTVPLGYYVGRSTPPPAPSRSPETYEAPFGASDTYATMWVDAPDGQSIELRGGETYPAGPEMGRIPHGAPVRVYGACLYGDEIDGVQGPWCSVGYGGQRGWAFSPYLLSGSSVP